LSQYLAGDDHTQAGVAEPLFISGTEENDIAIQVHGAALQGDERGQVGGNHTFVVNRATAPEITVLDDASEGIDRPFAAVYADDVHVGDKKKGF